MRVHYVFLFVIVFCVSSQGFSLRINEVCSSNSTLLTDHLGRTSDWIEIKNTSTNTIDLNLYCLSDSRTNLTKFRFPAGSTIAPGQIILVWAVNETPTIAPNGDFCGTNFAISMHGEAVFLSLFSNGVIIDQMPNTPIPTDMSYGRVGSGSEWFYFSQPTPRTENTTQGYTAILVEPLATQNSGWFANSVVVNFTTNQNGVQVRYTTDGSNPTENSPVWSGPLTLYDRSAEPNTHSLISTVLPDLPQPVNELDWWFAPATNVPKIHTIRARCFSPGALPSKTVTRSYMVGIDLYDLPVVSIVMDPVDLFDPDVGIYVAGNGYDGVNFTTANFMQEWDRPMVSDWFDVSGNHVYQKEAETEIHGTYSARAGMKSLRLKTSGIPPDMLNYPFFGNDYLSSFRYLNLRNSGNDVHMTLFRDNFVGKLLKEQNLDVANFTPYKVFLSGEYWGIHSLQERVREHFLQEHYGIPVSNLDVLERNMIVNSGDNLDYAALIDFVQQNDVTDPIVWQYLETKIDMRNFREYMAGVIYAGNTDWPGNNIRFWRKRVPFTPNAPYGHDGRWRWLVYDMDFSYGLYQDPYWTHNTLARALDDTLGWRTVLLRSLIQNTNFKSKFINTFADRLNYNWQAPKVIASINQYEHQFETSMPMHIERWSLPSSMALWRGEVNALRIFATNRPDFLRNSILSQFGLSGTANIELQIQPANAAVIRMNDTVELTSGTYTYFQGVPVSMAAVPSPGWEVLSFGGEQTDTLTIVPSSYHTVQLILQQTVPIVDEVSYAAETWNVRFFPNPIRRSVSDLSLRFDGSGYKRASKLKFVVYNIKGQKVVGQIIPDYALKLGLWTFPIEDLSAGIYIFKVVDKKDVLATHKVLIR